MRQGYFFVDPVDSRPGAPAFNRTLSLKDTWAGRAAARPAARRGPKPAREAPAEITAPRRTRREARAELRAATPELARRFDRYRAELGLAAEQADLLSGDPALAAYYDAAVEAGAGPTTAARWLLNELLGQAGDIPLGELPLSGAAFGRFAALLDAGRLSPAGGKALLAALVAGGGDPEARMAELGLSRVEDRGAIDRAIARVLDGKAAEVARYRAGERKLLGFLLGAVMKEAGGAADAGLVRKALEDRLG